VPCNDCPLSFLPPFIVWDFFASRKHGQSLTIFSGALTGTISTDKCGDKYRNEVKLTSHAPKRAFFELRACLASHGFGIFLKHRTCTERDQKLFVSQAAILTSPPTDNSALSVNGSEVLAVGGDENLVCMRQGGCARRRSRAKVFRGMHEFLLVFIMKFQRKTTTIVSTVATTVFMIKGHFFRQNICPNSTSLKKVEIH